MSDEELKSAIISPCGAYRYTLTRWWGEEAPGLLWVLLNPSTADGEQDDPTVRKLRAYARAWGAPGFVVVNVFAFRATNPWEVAEAAVDPVGPENDAHIAAEAARAQAIVIGWGVSLADTPIAPRFGDVLRLLEPFRAKVGALKLTKSGAPTHPLYLAAKLRPVRYPAEHWPAAPEADLFGEGRGPKPAERRPRTKKAPAAPAASVTERLCRHGSLWSWAPVAGAWRAERVAGCACEDPAPLGGAKMPDAVPPSAAAGASPSSERAPSREAPGDRGERGRRTRPRGEDPRPLAGGPAHPPEVGLFGEVPRAEPRPRAPRRRKGAAAAAAAPAPVQAELLTAPPAPAITPALPQDPRDYAPGHPQAGAQATPPAGDDQRDAPREESPASADPGGPEPPPEESEAEECGACDPAATPAVGELWLCDLRGRVPWATNYSERTRGRVRLTWASRDGRVFEGGARRSSQALEVRVTLARSCLLGRV